VGVTNSKEVWDADIREGGVETRDMQTYESEYPSLQIFLLFVIGRNPIQCHYVTFSLASILRPSVEIFRGLSMQAEQ
jgi:hypothetical protein